MTFEIGSAQLAFDLLHPLAVDAPKEQWLEDAEYDLQGNLKSIELHWLKRGNRQMKSWDNTILGKIRIHERTLIAEVNSEARAVRLREEIENRLGLAVSHKSTVVKPYKDLLEETNKRGPSGDVQYQKEQDKLMKDPVVQKQLREMLQKETDLWIKRKLPALGGLTPLQAAKHADGKDIVESLVIDYERHIERAVPKEVRPDMSFVRKRLKLDARRPISQ